MVCTLEFRFIWILSEEIDIYMAIVSLLFLEVADESAAPAKERKKNK